MTDFTGDEEFAVFAEALEKAAKRDAKKRKRALVKKLAAALTEDYRRAADAKIAQAVIESEAFASARTVFCYVSVRTEPDTAAIMEAAWRAGKRVAVPRCAAVSASWMAVYWVRRSPSVSVMVFAPSAISLKRAVPLIVFIAFSSLCGFKCAPGFPECPPRFSTPAGPVALCRGLLLL